MNSHGWENGIEADLTVKHAQSNVNTFRYSSQIRVSQKRFHSISIPTDIWFGWTVEHNYYCIYKLESIKKNHFDTLAIANMRIISYCEMHCIEAITNVWPGDCIWNGHATLIWQSKYHPMRGSGKFWLFFLSLCLSFNTYIFANIEHWPIEWTKFWFPSRSMNTDVEDVKFVINFDYPNNSEEYIHRIGRTGRSNNTGTAYTLFTIQNAPKAGDLVNVLKEANQVGISISHILPINFRQQFWINTIKRIKCFLFFSKKKIGRESSTFGHGKKRWHGIKP